MKNLGSESRHVPLSNEAAQVEGKKREVEVGRLLEKRKLHKAFRDCLILLNAQR